MDACLDEDAMLVLVGKRATNLNSVHEHLDRCDECRGVFAALVRSAREGKPESGPRPRTLAGIPRARVDRSPTASRLETRRRGPAKDGPRADELVAGRFVLEHSLGSGAMGIVWAARDLASGERRALKFVHSAAPEQIRRMRREAAVLRDLRHPNIVWLHEIIETTERGPALVMDLLEGESLEARLSAKRTLSLTAFIPIARGILEALAASHAHGIVHRDLKPANIFLERRVDGEGERVRVLDFGMAKLTAAWQSSSVALTPAITRSGTVMGTPLYMAPEQVFGERGVDARADLWAFGVILHRALSGRMPVEARSFADVMRALTAGAVRPLETPTPIPPAASALARQLLSIRPGDRPASAREVRTALDEATS